MRRSWRSAGRCRRNAAQIFRVLRPAENAFEVSSNPRCEIRKIKHGRCCRAAGRNAQTMRLRVQMFLSVASGSLGPATERAFVPTAAPVVSSSGMRLSSMSMLLQTRATSARLQQQLASPSTYSMRRAALSSWGWVSSSSSSSSSVRRYLTCMSEAAAGEGGGMFCVCWNMTHSMFLMYNTRHEYSW